MKTTNQQQLIIRDEVLGDSVAIRTVHQAAFPTAAEGQLVDALRNAGHLTISLVAELDGGIVGHIALSPVTINENAACVGGLGLAPVAVAPTHQRRGIGGRLVHDGLARAAVAGGPFVVVLGDPKYYSRFGFVAASKYGLTNEYGAGDEFMTIELQGSGVPSSGGLVRYAPEFAMFA